MLKMKEGEIVTADCRLDIIEYIVTGHSALYVDQANPLNVCYDDEDVIKRKMEAPLLIDMQTANAMRLVRAALKPENQPKFDKISWAKLGEIVWKYIK